MGDRRVWTEDGSAGLDRAVPAWGVMCVKTLSASWTLATAWG